MRGWSSFHIFQKVNKSTPTSHLVLQPLQPRLSWLHVSKTLLQTSQLIMLQCMCMLSWYHSIAKSKQVLDDIRAKTVEDLFKEKSHSHVYKQNHEGKCPSKCIVDGVFSLVCYYLCWIFPLSDPVATRTSN